MRRRRRAGDEIAQGAGRDHQEAGELLVGQRRRPAPAPGEGRACVEVPPREDEERAEQARELAGEEQAPTPLQRPESLASSTPRQKAMAAASISSAAASSAIGCCDRPVWTAGACHAQRSSICSTPASASEGKQPVVRRLRSHAATNGATTFMMARCCSMRSDSGRSRSAAERRPVRPRPWPRSVPAATGARWPERKPRQACRRASHAPAAPPVRRDGRCRRFACTMERPRGGASRRERVRPSFVPDAPRRWLQSICASPARRFRNASTPAAGHLRMLNVPFSETHADRTRTKPIGLSGLLDCSTAEDAAFVAKPSVIQKAPPAFIVLATKLAEDRQLWKFLSLCPQPQQD